MTARIVKTIGIAIAAATAALASPMPAAQTTGVLTGRVLTDAPVPAPVRRATVRLSTGGINSARLVGTDNDGRFTFTDLPAGRYTLSASKLGFVDVFYGSKHPGRPPGVPVAIAAGEHADATLRMLPGAVITGTITDGRGAAVAGLSVTAIEVRPVGAPPGAATHATTDDRGVYRVFGLAPGDYLLSSAPPPAMATDAAAVSDDEASWARRLLDRGATGGAPMGASPSAPAASTQRAAYAPVYFPGTSDPGRASTISVNAGEERAGIDLSVRPVPVARVAGTIVDASGQPASPATVQLFPRDDGNGMTERVMASGVVSLLRATMTPGAFSISGVAPGGYTLVARSGSSSRSGGPGPASPATQWSITDLTISGGDRTDLALQLLPGLKLSGTIAFDRTTTQPPADLTGLEISLVSARAYLGAAAAPRAIVEPPGSFRFSGIAVPAVYRLVVVPPRAAPGAAGWALKSAMLNGRDLADGTFELKPGEDMAGLVVTFTDHAAEISGRLVDDAGRPITRYSVVVIAADRADWQAGGRRMRVAAPATDGSFVVPGLPPGEYAVAAAEDVESSDLSDPQFLAQLMQSAFRITLADGEKKRQDLTIARR